MSHSIGLREIGISAWSGVSALFSLTQTSSKYIDPKRSCTYLHCTVSIIRKSCEDKKLFERLTGSKFVTPSLDIYIRTDNLIKRSHTAFTYLQTTTNCIANMVVYTFLL